MDITVVEAKAKRKCRMCGEAITKGQRCLTVRVNGPRFAFTGTVCLDCLVNLHHQLDGSVPIPEPQRRGFDQQGGFRFDDIPTAETTP